jgi:hypothetical protein
MRTLQVMTHGHCFDGLVSAALFASWCRAQASGRLTVRYRTCGYGPKLKTLPDAWFSADWNALLDFRYDDHPKLTHYLDHHATAFRDEEQKLRALDPGRRGKRVVHFDPEAKSCAGLIARVAREAGFDVGVADLVLAADQVDSASFISAEEPFFARSPALQLADVAERHADAAFVAELAPLLVERPLEEIVLRPSIQEKADAIRERKLRFLEAVRASGAQTGDVARVDLSEAGVEVAGKFATYLAFPTCRYSVTLLKTPEQLKLGVGWNPFGGKERLHDLGERCRALGGGGHKAVGAVAFARTDLDRARATLATLATELAG